MPTACAISDALTGHYWTGQGWTSIRAHAGTYADEIAAERVAKVLRVTVPTANVVRITLPTLR